MKKDDKNIDEEDTVVVMTVRCIDMAPAIDVDKIECSECGEMTWISKSFRGKKIDKIVCEHCFDKIYGNDKEYLACTTQECIDEALDWAKRSGYNLTEEEVIRSMENKLGKNMKIEKVFD